MLQMLVKKKSSGVIGALKLDATLSYTQDRSNAISSFPIERGSPITDHVRGEPLTLKMDGFITNSPIVLFGLPFGVNAGTSLGDPAQSAVDRAFKELNRLDDTKDPFTVVTGMSRYTNMVFKSLSIPRDPSHGQSLRFTATLQKITIVDPKLVTLPNVKKKVVDKATSKTDTGSDTTTTASEKAKSRVSFLKNVINSLQR